MGTLSLGACLIAIVTTSAGIVCKSDMFTQKSMLILTPNAQSTKVLPRDAVLFPSGVLPPLVTHAKPTPYPVPLPNRSFDTRYPKRRFRKTNTPTAMRILEPFYTRSPGLFTYGRPVLCLHRRHRLPRSFQIRLCHPHIRLRHRSQARSVVRLPRNGDLRLHQSGTLVPVLHIGGFRLSSQHLGPGYMVLVSVDLEGIVQILLDSVADSADGPGLQELPARGSRGPVHIHSSLRRLASETGRARLC